MKYLLDTNVLSELTKSQPEQKVVEFLSRLPKEQIFVSCVTIGELKKGLALCKDGNKRKRLNDWFEQYLLNELKDQIINLDSEIMCEWGNMVTRVKDIPILDSLIAATALVRGKYIVTRNVKDFEKIKELKIINPWR